MEALKTKMLLYDSNCPMCKWYTGHLVKTGLITGNGRVAFEQLSPESFCKLDFNRARHEIPMVDATTGEVLYGVEALCLIAGNSYRVLNPLVKQPWFKQAIKPLYAFISYNRRILAGGATESDDNISFAPDFNSGWRMALIATGFGYTAICIYTFACLMAISPVLLLECVTLYFLLLLIFDLVLNTGYEMQLDYVAHLAVLGFVEGTLFVVTALLAKLTGLTGLMFAGQGAGRLVAIGLHVKRVKNNHYDKALNYVFAAGALALVFVIAILKVKP